MTSLSLSLSGGGFRATLFHLGVIRYLHDASLLGNVSQIGAVSGGSIVAAHLVLNWERYRRSPAAFEQAAEELIEFIQSDVRGRIMRRWCFHTLSLSRFAWRARRRPVHRTALLVREYERLLGSATLDDFTRSGRPELFLFATCMNTGQCCSFDGTGFRYGEPGKESSIKSAEYSVAVAVAASSAFPPAFPPVAVSHKAGDARHESPAQHYLTDGGVFDNLAIDHLFWQHKQDRKPGRFILSDAEVEFSWDLAPPFQWLLPRSVRVAELLMKRVSAHTHDSLRLGDVPITHISIGSVVQAVSGSQIPSPAVQRAVGAIRTDLNRFSDLEVQCLIRQGYIAARQEFQGLAAPLPGDDGAAAWSWMHPVPRQEHLKDLRKARKRSWSLLAWRDGITWANIALLGFWLFWALPHLFGLLEDWGSRLMRRG